MKRTLVTLLAIATLAGCGGSDPKPPLTKAEFIAQGDKLCADFHAHNPATVQAHDWAGIAKGSKKAAAVESDFRDSFAALNAPADGRAVRARVLAAEDRAASLTRKIADLAGHPSERARITIVAYEKQLNSILGPLRVAMRAYGFKVCGLPRST